jgi:ZIP family zinc transporter
MAVYSLSTESFKTGLLIALGVGLHNIPMGLVIASTLITTRFSKRKMRNILIGVSLSTFVGGLIMFILGGVNELAEGILLGLTLGMLMYIAIFELGHQIYHMKDNKTKIFGISIGVLLLIIGVIIEQITH